MSNNPDSLEFLQRFEFTRHHFDSDTGTLNLRWRWRPGGSGLSSDAGVVFEEIFQFPNSGRLNRSRRNALAQALKLIHWIAGVSYWKIRCTGSIDFADSEPDRWQADALDQLYQHGLAEMAWRNQLHQRYWPDFSNASSVDHSGSDPAGAQVAGLNRRVLVALGGGKDSLVALERVRAAGFTPVTVQVGSAGLIGQTAEAAGTVHRVITRTLSPELKRLNAAGALNGHVPITAINSAVLVVAAIIWNFDTVVFANERSADSPTLLHAGRSINHQFAKSFGFEILLADWIERYIATDLRVFSILRRESELSVCKAFAGLTQYHSVFSSCNRNFHLEGPRTDRWCGHCPKCLFVYLALAPFMTAAQMQSIFGADLLNDPTLTDGFAALLELDGHRPFECIGEANEARAALKLLLESERWQRHSVVQALNRKMAEQPDRLNNVDPETLLNPAGPDRIPREFSE